MRLLIKKEKRGKLAINKNGISINKSGIGIIGTAIDKVIDKTKDNYVSLGFDNYNNLCLFISYDYNKNFYKCCQQISGRACRANISSKKSIKAIEPFIGNYEIQDVIIVENGIRKAKLRKIN